MIRKIFSILAILLLSGLLINGITMTQQLKKIHSSLEENVESIQQLNHVQASIIDKNKELIHMANTLGQIDSGLIEITEKTNNTLVLLSSVVDYNANTLALNSQMNQSSQQSKQQIEKLQSSLAGLSPYLQNMDQLLKQLSTIASQDQQHLRSILESTKTLNRKTPGVKLR